MIINIIVAYCNNNGIGKDNSLVWNIKSDMAKFKQLTSGTGNNAIIMGKNTFLSLNNEYGLANRDNLILSKSLKLSKYNGKHKVQSFINAQSLEEFVKTQNYDTVWVIGGEQIYRLFLDNYTKDESSIFNISKIYITYINKDYECTSFFPDLAQYTSKYNLLFYNKKVHGNAYANNNSSTNTNDSSISDSYTIYDIEYVFV
jgi:dihydrofolate reductase|uniref:dihydrofolate reductase n=1 Tax=viral metagenome TaxID=1070528 RepID=A0A6C0CBP7_9ZZZZ